MGHRSRGERGRERRVLALMGVALAAGLGCARGGFRSRDLPPGQIDASTVTTDFHKVTRGRMIPPLYPGNDLTWATTRPDSTIDPQALPASSTVEPGMAPP